MEMSPSQCWHLGLQIHKLNQQQLEFDVARKKRELELAEMKKITAMKRLEAAEAKRLAALEKLRLAVSKKKLRLTQFTYDNLTLQQAMAISAEVEKRIDLSDEDSTKRSLRYIHSVCKQYVK